jgi:hypothetical protein
MNSVIQPRTTSGFPPPLRVAPDMPSVWRDVDFSFDEGAEAFVQAHRADGPARDLPIMDLRLYGIAGQGEHFALKPIMGHEPPHALRAAAFSMLCARLGAPVEFLRDRLPAPVQLAVLNVLMAQSDRATSALLRLRGEEVSAVVSERYAPLDAEELVEGVRSALVRHGMLETVRVRGLATGMTDVLRLVLPNEQEAIQVGDVTAVGLDVSTSSFGRSALSVRGSLWRLVCKNGLRVPSGLGEYSFRHVGDARRLKDGLSDAVPSAVAHARGLLGTWQRAVNVYVDQVSKLIEGMRELSIEERRGVEVQLMGGAGTPALPERTSVYDFTNALTAAAQASEPARRIELETHAGEWLHRHAGGVA